MKTPNLPAYAPAPTATASSATRETPTLDKLPTETVQAIGNLLDKSALLALAGTNRSLYNKLQDQLFPKQISEIRDIKGFTKALAKIRENPIFNEASRHLEQGQAHREIYAVSSLLAGLGRRIIPLGMTGSSAHATSEFNKVALELKEKADRAEASLHPDFNPILDATQATEGNCNQSMPGGRFVPLIKAIVKAEANETIKGMSDDVLTDFIEAFEEEQRRCCLEKEAPGPADDARLGPSDVHYEDYADLTPEEDAAIRHLRKTVLRPLGFGSAG